jgi:uncharacterized protein YjbI with pentapeptide repeats
MDTRRLRDSAVLLPGDDPDDLDPVTTVPRMGTAVTDALITSDAWIRADLSDVGLARCWLVNADLSGLRWTAGTLDRCAFRGCTLIGANLDDLILKNVVFENCRLDYTTMSNLRAGGPLFFLGCSLAETEFHRSKLATAVFDGCKFAATSLDKCDLRGADLRGNDLSTITGVSSLRGARLAHDQTAGLIEAVVRDLQIDLRD